MTRNKWHFSTEGGAEPLWNANGQELFYRSGDKMMSLDIATQPSFATGKPRMLFERRYVTIGGTVPEYDVAPYGQRSLMLKAAEPAQSAPTRINVVLTSFAKLKQKVHSEEVMVE